LVTQRRQGFDQAIVVTLCGAFYQYQNTSINSPGVSNHIAPAHPLSTAPSATSSFFTTIPTQYQQPEISSSYVTSIKISNRQQHPHPKHNTPINQTSFSAEKQSGVFDSKSGQEVRYDGYPVVANFSTRIAIRYSSGPILRKAGFSSISGLCVDSQFSISCVTTSQRASGPIIEEPSIASTFRVL
jgi:hypothetical protein